MGGPGAATPGPSWGCTAADAILFVLVMFVWEGRLGGRVDKKTKQQKSRAANVQSPDRI